MNKITKSPTQRALSVKNIQDVGMSAYPTSRKKVPKVKHEAPPVKPKNIRAPVSKKQKRRNKIKGFGKEVAGTAEKVVGGIEKGLKFIGDIGSLF